MDQITKKAWEVFWASFKNGEDVVVEDANGDFFYGTLRASDEGILLTRTVAKSRFLDWDDIAFIAHDGFPVQPIMGMTPEEAVKRASMEPVDVVREALESLGKEPEPEVVYQRVGGGCPWVADPVALLTIHNRGNSNPRFWMWPYDSYGEVMVFGAKDGAVMHSYDTEHLFLRF